MSTASETWYVRLPDGRVLRAASTAAMRHHINSGRIPLDSWVRRTPEEEWATLEWTADFADLIAQLNLARGQALSKPDSAGTIQPRPASLASRLDPLQLQTVGVRGTVEELLAALDSTVVRVKLRVAGVLGLLMGVVVALFVLVALDRETQLSWISWAGLGGALVLLVTLVQALLTHMTYVEVSRLRPARWADALTGLPRSALHLLLVNVVVFGGVLAALYLLRQSPAWVWANLDLPEWGRLLLEVVAFLLEILLWPLVWFALLLPAFVVVEEYSFITAIWHWQRLLISELGRVFLYEAIALGMGVMVTLPLALILGVGTWGQKFDKELWGALSILGGVALSPLLAYLTVANLFIYLHLRYEQAPQRKK